MRFCILKKRYRASASLILRGFMKKYALLHSVFVMSVFAMSVVGAVSAEPTHIHKKYDTLRQVCGDVVGTVSQEMGDDTELGERIMQVYGWAMQGKDKPKQYKKDYILFEKECNAVFRHKISPELYAKLHRLNLLGKKQAGMASGRKVLLLGLSVALGLFAIAALAEQRGNIVPTLDRELDTDKGPAKDSVLAGISLIQAGKIEESWVDEIKQVKQAKDIHALLEAATLKGVNTKDMQDFIIALLPFVTSKAYAVCSVMDYLYRGPLKTIETQKRLFAALDCPHSLVSYLILSSRYILLPAFMSSLPEVLKTRGLTAKEFNAIVLPIYESIPDTQSEPVSFIRALWNLVFSADRANISRTIMQKIEELERSMRLTDVYSDSDDDA
jgi:hypothetical protein